MLTRYRFNWQTALISNKSSCDFVVTDIELKVDIGEKWYLGEKNHYNDNRVSGLYT